MFNNLSQSYEPGFAPTIASVNQIEEGLPSQTSSFSYSYQTRMSTRPATVHHDF